VTSSLRDSALALAHDGWEVLPLCRKAPLTAHGVHDATTYHEQIARWWRRWPEANVGGKVPAGALVIDFDPRSGSDQGRAALARDHSLPAILTTLTGRGDGGMQLYFNRPAGAISGHRLPPGIDLKLNGCCVLPPSIHPDGGSYRWQLAQIAPCPAWLHEALRPVPRPKFCAARGREGAAPEPRAARAAGLAVRER